jgi:hypothetical protein
MRPSEIEYKVLRVLDALRVGAFVEDSLIELKADWSEAGRAARRIAGACNAARGDPVLWIVGADEKRGILGAPSANPADWWAQVVSQFEGTPPDHSSVTLIVPEGVVTAFCFLSDRAPFVVKNPAHGSPQAGPVSHEVPWRAATGIRSANRADLLRILVPRAHFPTVDVLSASAQKSLFPAQGDSPVHLRIHLYVTPFTSSRLTFPTHRLSGTLSIPSTSLAAQVGAYYLLQDSENSAIVCTQREFVVNGPGAFGFMANAPLPIAELSLTSALELLVHMYSPELDATVSIPITLLRVRQDLPEPLMWEWGPDAA